MKLSLDALQVLDAIERKGSFAAAANELHRVPSAITYTIQQLEQDLDVLVFDRSKHRASLTAAGYELLNEGRILLRAASDLECRIQQVATGWESELRIAMDTIFGAQPVFNLVQQFYAEHGEFAGGKPNANRASTKIKISEEVLGGGWDALVSGRADLVIGASGDAPPGGGFATLPLARIPFLFVAAPNHPITREAQPLTEDTILKYRAVSVADTSRSLPPRTAGLLSGQDIFTVPTMRAKVAAHVAGLGVGYLPKHMAEPQIKLKKLTALSTLNNRNVAELLIAWRANRTGKALRWFAQQLEKKSTIKRLLES